MMRFYTLFMTQDSENHTLFSGTYMFRPHEGVSPPPGLPGALKCTTNFATLETRRKLLGRISRKARELFGPEGKF